MGINLRARSCEAGIPLDYLKALHAAYEVFIQDISRVIPVIKVDYERFRTAEEMAKVIKSEYAKIANIRHVTFSDVLLSSSPSTSPEKKKLKVDEDNEADPLDKVTAVAEKKKLTFDEDNEADPLDKATAVG